VLFFRDVPRDEIEYSAKRTQPATEESAKNYGKQHHQDTRQKNHSKCFLREEIAYGNKGVCPEKAVNSSGDNILSTIFC